MKQIYILTLDDDTRSRELLSELVQRGFSVKLYTPPKAAPVTGAPAEQLRPVATGQADPRLNGLTKIEKLATMHGSSKAKVKKIGGLGIYENFVKWVGDRQQFSEASWKMWFGSLQEPGPDGKIRRFKLHSFSTLKHELTASGLMICRDGQCLVDPETLRRTSGQQMRDEVQRIRDNRALLAQA